MSGTEIIIIAIAVVWAQLFVLAWAMFTPDQD